MKLAKGLFFILIFSFSKSWATRPVLSLEQVVQLQTTIFEGLLTEIKEVDAPVQEQILTYQKKALSLKLKVLKQWKGDKLKDSVTVYTWPLGEAPCPGVKVRVDQKLLIFTDWDRSHKIQLLDFCRGVHDLAQPYTADILKAVEKATAEPKK